MFVSWVSYVVKRVRIAVLMFFKFFVLHFLSDTSQMANCDTLIPALPCEKFLSNNKVNFRFASNRSYTKYKPWFENALDLTVKS